MKLKIEIIIRIIIIISIILIRYLLSIRKINIKYYSSNNTILTYETSGSAGIDLKANHNFEIQPNSFCIISTGIFIEIPKNMEGQIRSRSGLAFKNNIFVLNSPGTIDSDYRGEIKIILFNLGKEVFIGKSGFRIAQIIFNEIKSIKLNKVNKEDLENTKRGENGFGSTGL